MKSIEFFSVKHLYDVLHKCIRDKLYFPFVLFERTQGTENETKHRSVYGGNILMKYWGCVHKAAKLLGLSKEACTTLNIPTTPDAKTVFRSREDLPVDIDKERFPAPGGIPMKADMNWDLMFTIMRDKFPKDSEHAREISAAMGYNLRESDVLDIIGEDYSKYDTTIIREDLQWIVAHSKMGWMFQYMLDALEFSEVWIGAHRVLGIFYKSGRPFTSDFGSIVHIVRQDAYAAESGAIKLASCVQADDNITWWVNADPKAMSDFNAKFGLTIKADASYSWNRDGIVRFLQVDIGRVMFGSEETNDIDFIGNPVSRYYGLAHSEREIEAVEGKPDELKGDWVGIYKITEDVFCNAYLSKLSSYSSRGKSIIMLILKLFKNTKLGNKGIAAIENLRPGVWYHQYYSDVVQGFNPALLNTLAVSSIRTEASTVAA